MASLAAITKGKRVLLVGSDTLLGRAILSRIVRSCPDVNSVRCMARAPSAAASRSQFERDLASVSLPAGGSISPTGVLLEPAPGSYGTPNLGLAPAELQELSATTDLIINCAKLPLGSHDFEEAFQVHVHTALALLALRSHAHRYIPYCIAVSCYSERPDDVPVEEIVHTANLLGPGAALSDADAELNELESAFERLRTEAGSATLETELRSASDTVSDGGHWSPARRARERRRWLTNQYAALGDRHARRWGWPNAILYAQALGVRLATARSKHAEVTIVRHGLLVASLEWPEPGWLDGPEPLSAFLYIAARGYRAFPAFREQIVDVVPVDWAAHVCVTAAVMTLAGRAHGTYHATLSDRHPLTIGGILDHTASLLQQWRRDQGPSLFGELTGPFAVAPCGALARGAQHLPLILEALARRARRLSEAEPRRMAAALPRFARTLRTATAYGASVGDRCADALEHRSRMQRKVVETFGATAPFAASRRGGRYESLRSRALLIQISDPEHVRLEARVAELNWPKYWSDVHLEGVRRQAFVRLGMSTPAIGLDDVILTPFDVLARMARLRPASLAVHQLGARQLGNLSFTDLFERARTLRNALASRGVGPGVRVAIVGDNACLRALAFFAATSLRAGIVTLAHKLGAADLDDHVASDCTIILCDTAGFESAWQSRPRTHHLLHLEAAGLPRHGSHEPAAIATSVDAYDAADHCGPTLQCVRRMGLKMQLRDRDRFLCVSDLSDRNYASCNILLPVAMGNTAIHASSTDAWLAAVPEAKPEALVVDQARFGTLLNANHINARAAAEQQPPIRGQALAAISRWTFELAGLRPPVSVRDGLLPTLPSETRYVVVSARAPIPPSSRRRLASLGIETIQIPTEEGHTAVS